MPQEIVFSTVRSDDAAADRRERPLTVSLEEKEFIQFKQLLQEAGYWGLDLGSSYQPNSQTLKMLVSTIRRALQLIDQRRGQPFDAFRTESKKAKLNQVIALCEVGLGLALSKQVKVDRAFQKGHRVPEAEARLSPLPPEVAAAIFRPRG